MYLSSVLDSEYEFKYSIWSVLNKLERNNSRDIQCRTTGFDCYMIVKSEFGFG